MVRRGTLPIYPIHLLLNYPGAFNKRLSLKLSVLTTKIPIACVGVLTNSGPCPQVFYPCPHTVSWLGRVAPLAGTPLCRFSNNGTPGHDTVSEPTSSLDWGVPSLATPPQRSRGRLAPRAPFRGSPVPTHCSRGLWRPGPRISGSPVPTTLSRPPIGPWPTVAD